MYQNLIAIIVVSFFITKLVYQRKKLGLAKQEFFARLSFWLSVLIIIFALKYLDIIVKELGFSASGIQVLLYLSVAILFNYVFRLRLKLQKTEESLTKIVQTLAIKNK